MTSEIHLVPNILQFYGFIHLFIQNVFTEDYYQLSFHSGSMVKNVPANAGHVGSIPGLGKSHEEGNGNLLQCSCLGNPMDRGVWWATVHRLAESNTTWKHHAHTIMPATSWHVGHTSEGHRQSSVPWQSEYSNVFKVIFTIRKSNEVRAKILQLNHYNSPWYSFKAKEFFYCRCHGKYILKII